ncbi:HAMP domain-containing sensor histidine kinase [Ideonella sp.]|uniref:HAMP domain-containing sensor histidine kinase n=1 Tax=Ideonella sp. TaxID=1929293 RepID=UPI002B4A85CB|nr:HAMP domain-containing sensor histidine kinase [Ideonella sp.]HJV68137.1 HAMP domain-containing sensor histidine kinase [Ideonella sp.]
MSDGTASAFALSARWLDMPAHQASHALADLVADAQRRHDGSDLVPALIWLGLVLSAAGEAEADGALAQAHAEAVSHGDPALVWQAVLAQARHDADGGRHAQALVACRTVADAARSTGQAALARQALFATGTSLCHLGEHDLALEAFEEARMLLRADPQALTDADREIALGRYAAAQAQAWLMRGGLLLEASGPEASGEAFRRARLLGEQACTALLGASPRFGHAALFGLVRVLLEAGECELARAWVAKVRQACPRGAPPKSLASVHMALSEALIELRDGVAAPTVVLASLREAALARHPRVQWGDLRLSLLRCMFEAHECAGQYRDALACQREWARTKSELRVHLAREHGLWTASALEGLRAEADEFIGLALRAPLMAARESLSRLFDQAPAVAHGASRAQHSVSRAIDIADQYLGVVRAEHLRREDLQELDLSELVDDVCDQMAPPSGSGVHLQRRIDRPVNVQGDRTLLMRALGNLISNAFKHAPAGSDVQVGLHSGDEVVRLWVRDEGPGMSLDMRARVFQRFATGAVRNGNGLGLAMVARAARVHDAGIVVDSEPNQGTCVVIEFERGRAGVN